MNPAGFFARWRVRLGYPLAAVALWFARPTPTSILIGAVLGILGLVVRASAAGHLHKQEILTTSGPYAYTRNPLYLGSFILVIGAAVASRSWLSALLLCGYFALFYSFVMRREERELLQQHGAAFQDYAHTVPLFLPRLNAATNLPPAASLFSFAQYKKNREYRAAIGFALLIAMFLLIWRLRLPH